MIEGMPPKDHAPYLESDTWRPWDHDPNGPEYLQHEDVQSPYRSAHLMYGAMPLGSTQMPRGATSIIADGRGHHRVATGQMHTTFHPETVRAAIHAMIRGEIHPQDIEPRFLLGTQGGTTGAGMKYYLSEGNDYERAGQTYADQQQVGNRVPIIYQNEGVGNRYVLSGHHRVSAAILRGRPVKGLLVIGGPQDVRRTHDAINFRTKWTRRMEQP